MCAIMSKRRISVKYSLGCCFFFASVAIIESDAVGAVALQIGEAVEVEEGVVAVPVLLDHEGDRGVAALDFRVQYDPRVLAPISTVAGEVAQGAQKQVAGNVASPGEYVVVMMGLNQTECDAGEVARIAFELVEDEVLETTLTLSGATLSSRDGTAFPASGSTRRLRLATDASDDEAERAEPEPAEQEGRSKRQDADGDGVSRVADTYGFRGGSTGEATGQDVSGPARQTSPGGDTNRPGDGLGAAGRRFGGAADTADRVRSQVAGVSAVKAESAYEAPMRRDRAGSADAGLQANASTAAGSQANTINAVRNRGEGETEAGKDRSVFVRFKGGIIIAVACLAVGFGTIVWRKKRFS